MREISSKDNKIIRETAALSERKHRDERGLFLIEGPKLLKEALAEGVKLRRVFVSAASVSEELSEAAYAAERAGADVFQTSREAFAKISQTETPQGLVAVAEKKEISENGFFSVSGGDFLVLDRIQDPGNMGTLIRTADAAGFSGAILVKGSVDPYSPKVVRAAAGSLFRLPMLIGLTAERACELLRAHRKNAFAAAMNAGLAYYDAPLSEDAAIIIGNEGGGISEEMLRIATPVSIPMAGRTESLNAALAGGIIMFEALRQRAAAVKKQEK